MQTCIKTRHLKTDGLIPMAGIVAANGSRVGETDLDPEGVSAATPLGEGRKASELAKKTLAGVSYSGKPFARRLAAGMKIIHRRRNCNLYLVFP